MKRRHLQRSSQKMWQYLVFEIPQPERWVDEGEEDRKEDTDQWKDDIFDRLPKIYNNTLFFSFLSRNDEWVSVKRTGKRTPINEKTTFTTVFPKYITIPCFWDSWAWEMSGWGWRGQEGGHRSRRWSGFPTRKKNIHYTKACQILITTG